MHERDDVMESLKLSDYFKIIKPTYCYIKITPHKSIRNYNTCSIAKAVSTTYKSLDRRLHREQKKLIVESNFKVSYIIDIYGTDVNFYFVVPEFYKATMMDKIRDIWGKATVEAVDTIPQLSTEASVYQLSYKKDDALSLKVDKKTNEPLNQIMNTVELLQGDDRVTIIYNFRPVRIDWNTKYERTMKKIRNHENILKTSFSTEYIFKTALSCIASVLSAVVGVFTELTGTTKANTKESIYNAVLGVLDSQKELSNGTKTKKDCNIISTQIAVVSSSKDKKRQEENAVAVCQNFGSVAEDNELIYKRIKRKKSIDIEAYDMGVKSNYCSTDEAKNFIQLPGRGLLEEHNISYIKTEESNLPDELTQGTKCLGKVTFKGSTKDAYLENEYNYGNLPLVITGPQGGGKTTFIGNYAKDCINTGEGTVVIDFIKNCELSKAIERITPADRLITLDLAEESSLQGLGYNEIDVKPSMTPYQKLKYANMQSQLIMSFVDSISVGDPLSSRMRRFLNSAATLVFSQGYNSIKNVVECLENFQKRGEYIKAVPKELKEFLEDDINTLRELDDIGKDGKISGTKSSKIEHILDRVSMLREDFKLKYMYNKSLTNNINLVDCMRQGKIVLVKMRESDFPSKMIKNIMVTYWISKIWLASQVRGSKSDKPLRCNIIVDEVFQAPTSMRTLEYILPQSRKFGCKFIFSTQYLNQLDSIREVLEASGASYMLLKGALEDDFNHLKNKLSNFEYDDLKSMDQYCSLNLIFYSKGYASFISKLPKPI